MDAAKMFSLTALELGEAIKKKETTAVEAVQTLLLKIQKEDKEYRSYIRVFEKEALESASRVQKDIDAGILTGPLAGVPYSLKDNICTKGYLTTCASKILSNFVPPYSATAYERLEKEGMVLVGKLNMDEFAMGSTTETSFWGATKNPWNTKNVPGGSSGGSAAAVAADLSFFTLGSDTGGSIRQPCSFCGVSGIKPTYGKVSRYGLVAFASSLDQIGPIGKDIIDCAAVLNVISGKDEKDQTSVRTETISIEEAKAFSAKGLRIGIPKEYFGEGLEDDVRKAIENAIEIYKEMGAEVETFDLPIVEYAVPTYYIIACAEASSNLARYDGVKYGVRAENAEGLSDLYVKSRSESFGMEVKRRIMLGNFVLSSGYYDAYYKKALQVKSLVMKDFQEAFSKYDLILGPVAPSVAPEIGSNLENPLQMYLGDIYTVLINIAGLPAASIPCGVNESGLPVGLQLISSHYKEQTLVNAAAVFQKNTDFHKKRPKKISGG